MRWPSGVPAGGSLALAEGPTHILHPRMGAGWKDPGKEIRGRFLFQAWGGDPRHQGLHLGRGKHRRLSQGQVVFRTIVAFQGAGGPPSACLWLFAFLPPCPALVHLQLLTVSGGLLSVPRTATMGFFRAVQPPVGHGAVQQMQEAELRLLEGMRSGWPSGSRVTGNMLIASPCRCRTAGPEPGHRPYSPISQWDSRLSPLPPPPPANSRRCLQARLPLPFSESPAGAGDLAGPPQKLSSLLPAPPHCSPGQSSPARRGPEPVLRQHAEDLNSGPWSKLSLLDLGAPANAQNLQ